MIVRRLTLFLVTLASLLGLQRATAAPDWIYLTRPGDTLWDLCIEYSNKRGCWLELGKYNQIDNDRAIRPGTEIRFPRDWLIATPVVGRVDSVQGEVQYDERSSSTTVPLVAGQPLQLGSRIISQDGSALITLGNHSALRVRPFSQLDLDSLSTGHEPGQASELRLERGDVEVEVDPRARSRFEITTPAAIAAVRGTRYRVNSSSDGAPSTRSEVLAGAVAVQAASTVEVPAGYGIQARQNQALGQPRELPPAPDFEHSAVHAPLPIPIRWQADPGAVSWQLDLLQGGQSGELLATHRLDTPAFELAGVAQGCYQLVLRAIDAEGFNGLESQLPVCTVSPLPAPADLAIDKPDAAGAQYRLAWSPVAGASTYRLELATDSGFSNVISTVITEEPTAVVAAAQVEQLSARVTAIDEHGNAGPHGDPAHHTDADYTVPAILAALMLALVLL